MTRRILIVDDADEARGILAIALQTLQDVRVEVAVSAEDALSKLDGGTVDVVVTDFRMGGMSGLELLAALRERGMWPRCGAVVISGETDPDLRRTALEQGAAAFFGKPFSAGEVRRSVISLLESSHEMP
ncbi:MAG TPA: response regulator [Bryobacteraceae bacterium]